MTVTSRNLQVITGRAAREGARERVCFAQKPIAATKMALWATQQPQRGGTTSCASRPSAGIDRAKCLISLKATVQDILCTVTLERAAALVSGHTLACGPRRGKWRMEHEPRSGAGACEKCWEMLENAGRGGLARAAACVFISSPVVLNDIKDLAVLCLNWCTPIPIWVCRHRRDVEPCVDGKSNDIKVLASPGRPGEVVAIEKHSRDRASP